MQKTLWGGKKKWKYKQIVERALGRRNPHGQGGMCAHGSSTAPKLQRLGSAQRNPSKASESGDSPWLGARQQQVNCSLISARFSRSTEQSISVQSGSGSLSCFVLLKEEIILMYYLFWEVGVITVVWWDEFRICVRNALCSWISCSLTFRSVFCVIYLSRVPIRWTRPLGALERGRTPVLSPRETPGAGNCLWHHWRGLGSPSHRLIFTSGFQEQCEKSLFPWFVVVVKRRKSGLLL